MSPGAPLEPHFIDTASGVRLDLDDPRPENIKIGDIAGGLFVGLGTIQRNSPLRGSVRLDAWNAVLCQEAKQWGVGEGTHEDVAFG